MGTREYDWIFVRFVCFGFSWLCRWRAYLMPARLSIVFALDLLSFQFSNVDGVNRVKDI